MSKHVPPPGVGIDHRLFLGIEMPASVQVRLAELYRDIPGARWQWPTDLHLTLRFLGQVPATLLPRIGEVMQDIDMQRFDLQLHGVGTFGQRILWVGTTTDAPLQLFRQRLDTRLRPLGFETEPGDFVPHVTLARIHRSPGQAVEHFLNANANLRLPAWTVTHFCLFSSEPIAQGPVYRVVKRCALAAGQA